jgi:type III pantothenate kinase
MLLALDVGNTNITIGIFEGEDLRAHWRVATDQDRLADEYGILLLNLLGTGGLKPSEVTHAIIGSVVPTLTPVLEDVCHRYFQTRALTVGTGTRTGVRILYDNPREVGADRVVDAVAAIRLYGPPLVIVDFGTATVFDAVSADGDYLGGAIAPGIGIAAEALFQRASKLYRVQIERPRTAIGKNTAHAMQSGILFGYVGLVEGIVRRFQKELGGSAKVIGTGGWAETIARETSVIDVVDENLTLTGLRIIHELSRA